VYKSVTLSVLATYFVADESCGAIVRRLKERVYLLLIERKNWREVIFCWVQGTLLSDDLHICIFCIRPLTHAKVDNIFYFILLVLEF
jgi:hypothetical protein